MVEEYKIKTKKGRPRETIKPNTEYALTGRLYNALTPLASINLGPTFSLTKKVLAIPFLPFSKKVNHVRMCSQRNNQLCLIMISQ